MAMKWSLVADVSSVIKGTQDVGQAIEEVADTLDALGKETGQSSEQAADKLKHSFKDAFDAVQSEAKTTSKKLGDDVTDGARKAGDGIETFRDEGQQSIRETAASFSDVTDALDLVQEVAANALVGFGPAGMAAGAAAAIGIGLVKTMLDDAAEKANEAREATADLAAELIDVKGNPQALDWAEKLKEKLLEVVNTKEWYEFWEADNGPSTRLEEWSAKAQQYGLDMHDVTNSLKGDKEAEARVIAQLEAQINALNKAYAESIDMNGDGNDALLAQAAAVGDFRKELEGQAGQLDRAKRLTDLYNSSVDDSAEIQKRAEDAARTFSDALTEHLSVSDEGLSTFVKASGVSWEKWRKQQKEATKEGTLDLDAWLKEIKSRAKDAKLIEGVTVDLSAKLSPEALARFEELPTETQAQLAKAYGKSGKKASKIETALELEAKVSKVTVDTSAAQTEAEKNTVTVPTTIDVNLAAGQAKKAADAAQDEANKSSNEVQIKTRIDKDDLQRQVNRAAASIVPPTITIKTRVEKEVP
jgi:ElaB/YqjD/DUF883 family membrane-anchored ribosome-binding protein